MPNYKGVDVPHIFQTAADVASHLSGDDAVVDEIVPGDSSVEDVQPVAEEELIPDSSESASADSPSETGSEEVPSETGSEPTPEPRRGRGRRRGS